MDAFQPHSPVCFVSTHLDDVALSCANFLSVHPGCHVITVVGGAPEDAAAIGWDADTTGQATAKAAIELRMVEDDRAMALLDAVPSRLHFHDSLYRSGVPQDAAAIGDAITEMARRLGARSLVVPLGLRHPDHVAVSDACIDLADHAGLDRYVYEDMPYAQSRPESVPPRLSDVASRVELIELEPVGAADPTLKRRVVDCYATQVPFVKTEHTGFEASMTAPERYWRVRPGHRPPETARQVR